MARRASRGAAALAGWAMVAASVGIEHESRKHAAGEATWVRTGGPPSGVGYDIRVRPDNPDNWFVTDISSGVSVSYDAGRNWKPSNQGITGRAGPSGDAIPVFCLTIDPSNPDIIWAGTQNLRGIYKSVDGGKTWTEKVNGVAERNGITFRGFAVDPRDSRIVYAAGEISSFVWAGVSKSCTAFDMTRGVVYKTTDGGENWAAIWRGDNLARYVFVDPRDSRVVYVSTGFWDREAANCDAERGSGGGVGILKSVDQGQTWRILDGRNGLKNLYIGSLFLHPRNPQVLLAGAGANRWQQGAGVYLSENGGESWTQTLSLRQEITAVEICTLDPQVAYAASMGNFYRSADGGRTWRLMSGAGMSDAVTWGPPGFPAGIPSDLQVDPRTTDRVLVNSYKGGNLVSEDGGRTWADASVGYTGATTHDVAVDPVDPLRVYAITNSGPFRSLDGGNQWDGLHYVPVNVSDWFKGGWLFPEWNSVAVHPSIPGRVLFADELTGCLFLSANRSRDWKIVFHHPLADHPLTPGHGFKGLAWAPSNSLVAYAGMRRDLDRVGRDNPSPSYGVYKSTDGGETWREANDGQTADQGINVLVVDPRNENVVYAGTVRGGVFRSPDGGRSWRPLNQGLRSLDVRTLAIDPRNPLVLYAGVRNGAIYKTMDAGDGWEPRGAGIEPQATILDIVLDPTDSQVVYAASAQAGVYRSLNGGTQWTLLNSGLSTRATGALAISADGGTLYAATDGGGVFRLDLKARAETPVAAVSAASFVPDSPLAPESIGSLFGPGLATATQVAGGLPLPTSLAEVSVSITDSEGADHWAPLFFVSPGQINCQVPKGTAPGAATLRVLRQSRVVARGEVRIELVAPALFTANADGKGAPAALAARYGAGGTQTAAPVFQCGAAAGSCAPVAMDLGEDSEQLILMLYGTGLRGARGITATIGGVDAPVLGFAAQSQYAGLDQVNVRVPRELKGRGEVNVALTAEGKTANVVQIRIQ